MEQVLRVLAARDDLAVDFDGDPALAVAGFREQGGDRGCRLAVARLAVESDLHAAIVASAEPAFEAGYAESRSLPRDASAQGQGRPWCLRSRPPTRENGRLQWAAITGHRKSYRIR